MKILLKKDLIPFFYWKIINLFHFQVTFLKFYPIYSDEEDDDDDDSDE